MSNGDQSELTSLTLYDYSDRELLLILSEQAEADKSGYASTYAVADALGIVGENRLSSVGARLSVLRRVGAVEKDPFRSSPISYWNVTAVGRVMAAGKMDAQQEQVLKGMTAEQMLLLTRFVAQRYKSVGDSGGHLMRREWKGTTGLRS